MIKQNISAIKKITWYSIIINISLVIMKLIGGIVGHSQAVIADAVHSFSDLATDFVLLLGLKFWVKPADANHPYGHKRIETIVAFFISITLIITSFGIGYKAIFTLKEHHAYSINFFALIGILVSIVTKEILFRQTIAIGKKEKSPAVIANALDHRSDCFSSIVVAVSVFLSIINPKLYYVDHLGSIIVSIFILYNAGGIFRDSFNEIIETGIPDKYKKEIENLLLDIKDVKSFHAFRSRKIGSFWYIDLHIQVEPNLTVKEGHDIATIVKNTIINNIENVVDVVVHLEPY